MKLRCTYAVDLLKWTQFSSAGSIVENIAAYTYEHPTLKPSQISSQFLPVRVIARTMVTRFHLNSSEHIRRFHEQEWSQYIPGAQRQSNQCFIHFFGLSSFRIEIGIIWTMGPRIMHRMERDKHSSVTFIIGPWFVRWCCQCCLTMRRWTIETVASTPVKWLLTWTACMRRIGLRRKRSFVFPERTICTIATTTAREANLASAEPISEKGWKCHGSRAW